MDPIQRLHEIVRGIDKADGMGEEGWWETLEQAEGFGATKLAELEALIRSIA